MNNMNNTFKNFLSTSHINKQNKNEVINEQSSMVDLQKTFYQNTTGNKQNNKFTSNLNITNDFGISGENGHEDAKLLLKCYSIKTDSNNFNQKEPNIKEEMEILNKFNIKSDLINSDVDQIENVGFKSIYDIKKKSTFLNSDINMDMAKSFFDLMKPVCGSDRSEFYENPYQSKQDLKLNKQIYDKISDIQNAAQYNAYIEKHKQVNINILIQ